MDAAWRAYIIDWLRDHEALLLVVDTATGATRIDPWGEKIQQLYADVRAMLEAYPALAVILVVHVRKPSGHGPRQLSDVLGERGRWNDVTVLQENDGASLERAKLTVRKRVRQERRIVATKAGGLLIDPKDAARPAGPQVPAERVVEAVRAHPEGISYVDLGAALGVGKDTASRYVKLLPDQLTVLRGRNPAPDLVILTAAPPQTAAHEAADPLRWSPWRVRVPTPSTPDDGSALLAAARSIFADELPEAVA